MTDERIEYFKDKLLAIRKDLIVKLNDIYSEELDIENGGSWDMADEAYAVYNKSLLLGKAEIDATKLQLVNQALKRIAAGTYGICLECDEEIDEKRLEAVPFALHCIECKSELEKRGLTKI
jgi:DnaK suppressor protein